MFLLKQHLDAIPDSRCILPVLTESSWESYSVLHTVQCLSSASFKQSHWFSNWNQCIVNQFHTLRAITIRCQQKLYTVRYLSPSTTVCCVRTPVTDTRMWYQPASIQFNMVICIFQDAKIILGRRDYLKLSGTLFIYNEHWSKIEVKLSSGQDNYLSPC